MTGKPLLVVVLAHDGTRLGTMSPCVHNSLWRATKSAPRVTVGHTRACEPYGNGWAVRLNPGEVPPRSLQKDTEAA